MTWLNLWVLKEHYKAIDAMYRCMKHYVGTVKCGMTLQPSGNWDGKGFKFIISGRLNSDYAKDLDTRHSLPIQWCRGDSRRSTTSRRESTGAPC